MPRKPAAKPAKKKKKRPPVENCGRTWHAGNTAPSIAALTVAADLIEEAAASINASLTPDRLLSLLRKRRHTTEQICQATGAGESDVLAAIRRMQDAGFLVYLFRDEWGVEKAPPATSAPSHVYSSHPDGTYTFGFCGDSHICSKYARLDVLADLYDRFAAEGVDRVFHAGNWIDGEARFNLHDLTTHGMDPQIDELIEQYPRREGLTTYAVAGDDHEGWYGQREGIDIGKHAQQLMSEAGRTDWVNLGYMECFVELRHAGTGKSTQLLVIHPGGGSAYAHSYRPQKIVEGFSGGEKPAVLLIGHYHKISLNMIRNVYAIQCGCSQDQTPFMRKKGIEAHVGGGVCRIRQDEATGAIISCRVEFFQYFNRGYYNARWSHGGGVVLPERKLSA